MPITQKDFKDILQGSKLELKLQEIGEFGIFYEDVIGYFQEAKKESVVLAHSWNPISEKRSCISTEIPYNIVRVVNQLQKRGNYKKA